MNKVILMGRLTKDPELKYSQATNLAVTRFTIAVDRYSKEESEKQADFINCIAFGKRGEVVSNYFSKGNRILIGGNIKTGSYVNKEGNKVYTTDVLVEEIDFVESKKNSTQESTQKKETQKQDFLNIPDNVDESLPF